MVGVLPDGSFSARSLHKLSSLLSESQTAVLIRCVSADQVPRLAAFTLQQPSKTPVIECHVDDSLVVGQEQHQHDGSRIHNVDDLACHDSPIG